MIKNQLVKDWLKERGHSRSWLAAQCGVSKKTVDNWLSAGRPINASAATIINQLMIGRRSINPQIDLETFEAFRALCCREKRSPEEKIAELIKTCVSSQAEQ
jgi:hypothetical protein